MRVLLDTNLLIPVEPTTAEDVEISTPLIADLLRLLSAGQHSAYIHDASIAELREDRNLVRRNTRSLLLRKYQRLPSPPRVRRPLLELLGLDEPEPVPVDVALLTAVDANAVDFLITNDLGLQRRAARASLSDRVLTAADALALFRSLLSTISSVPPPRVEESFCHELDPSLEIFDSIRDDYPGFEGDGALDKFDVFVVLADSPTSGDIAARRYLLRLSDAQASYAAWIETPPIRPSDLYTTAEWAENTTKHLFVYLVFQKGDATNSGLGTGLIVDDVQLGQAGHELIARYRYDENVCSSPPVGEMPVHESACSAGTNYPKGQLTTVISYEDEVSLPSAPVARPHKMTTETRFVYAGLNGRPSAESRQIDWRGQEMIEWIATHTYDALGNRTGWSAPTLPEEANPRPYYYLYDRGLLAGVLGDSRWLLQEGGIEYNAAGQPSHIGFGNGAQTNTTFDSLYRPDRIEARAGNQSLLWTSGAYRYDGAGNIWQMDRTTDAQTYHYDRLNRLVRSQETQQASAGVGQVFDVGYTFDLVGNLTQRAWSVLGDPSAQPPVNIGLSRIFNNNRVTTAPFSYDSNGSATRAAGLVRAEVGMAWNPTGQLVAFFDGNPGDTEAAERPGPAERYLYDGTGLRVVRYQEGTDGTPIISLRDGGGTVVTEYTQLPGQDHPELLADYVYGLGQLLVERRAVHPDARVLLGSPLTDGNSYHVARGLLGGGSGAETHNLDIRAESGLQHNLSESPNTAGSIWLNSDRLAEGETNYIRIRGDDGAYSAAATLMIDPDVTSTSDRQVKAIGVTRDKENIHLEWALASENNKSFNIYYRRLDTNESYKLAEAIPPNERTLAIHDQSISVSCVVIEIDQINQDDTLTDRLTVRLPSALASQDLDTNPTNCEEPPSLPPFVFADRYHHRHHLGSLRIATDQAGWKIEGYDYYPFGRQMVVPGTSETGSSRFRFTGHERDDVSGNDYMMARYKNANEASFSSIDPLIGPFSGAAASWNRATYVENRFLTLTDPTGMLPSFTPKKVPQKGWVYTPDGTGYPTIVVRTFVFGGALEGTWGTYLRPIYGTIGYDTPMGVGVFYGVVGYEVAGGGGGGGGGPRTPYRGVGAERDRCAGLAVFDISDGLLTLDVVGGPRIEIPASSGTGACMNNPACTGFPDVGPIPPGTYVAYPSEFSHLPPLGALARQFFRLGDWGAIDVPLHPTEPGGARGGFHLHGGCRPGSAGCIDTGGGWFGHSGTFAISKVMKTGGQLCVRVQD